MDPTIDTYLNYLELNNLASHCDEYIADAIEKKISYHQLLSTIITDEYHYRLERRRKARIKAAAIPELLVMETFPFQRQPQLKKNMVINLYDSLQFIKQCQVLLFIGPTGCGKTGLATSFLVHAINAQYRGRFIDFKELIRQLYSSVADHSQRHIIKRFSAIDCLLIDELGYSTLDKIQAGLFFDLIKSRHKKSCTIITTQLGFDEWDSFINDHHLCAAILDRITENCTVFNMSKCISIRPKQIVYATDKTKLE